VKLYCPQCDEKPASGVLLAEHLQSKHQMSREAAQRRAYEVRDEVLGVVPEIGASRQVEKLPSVPIKRKHRALSGTRADALPLITGDMIDDEVLVDMIQAIRAEIARLEGILDEARRLLEKPL
jgi:hypothetical protein